MDSISLPLSIHEELQYQSDLLIHPDLYGDSLQPGDYVRLTQDTGTGLTKEIVLRLPSIEASHGYSNFKVRFSWYLKRNGCLFLGNRLVCLRGWLLVLSLFLGGWCVWIGLMMRRCWKWIRCWLLSDTSILEGRICIILNVVWWMNIFSVVLSWLLDPFGWLCKIWLDLMEKKWSMVLLLIVRR